MSDPKLIKKIIKTVNIPVMAKVRIGHFVEAQMLEALGIDFIDESEVLTPADEKNHIDKHDIKTPFVNGATYIGEACRRIVDGAAMIRTNGEAGVKTSLSSIKSISKASSTCASAKCPILHLAITGIETDFCIFLIISGSLILDMPPSLRMSDGILSRAITAHAPAFSAIIACS
jgi:pyridoxal 5'-phosphate synthase subunit Pdx1